jgi:DNA excision repair protein ERCC-2
MKSKRYARNEKRAKLPKWISAELPDGLVNLSTDVAIQLAKHFLRAMAQPFERSQLGISLWSEAQIQELEQGGATIDQNGDEAIVAA